LSSQLIVLANQKQYLLSDIEQYNAEDIKTYAEEKFSGPAVVSEITKIYNGVLGFKNTDC